MRAGHGMMACAECRPELEAYVKTTNPAGESGYVPSAITRMYTL